MAISAKNLELYSKPGSSKAAADISKAVTAASKAAIKDIGKQYDERRASRAISAAIQTHVGPVLRQYAEYGAEDTEPRVACGYAIISRVGKQYCLRDYELNDLRWSI